MYVFYSTFIEARFYIFQSESLSAVWYETDWYKFEKELQRDLMLVMLRARHPIFLAAGPFGNMSYATIVLVKYILKILFRM